MRPPPAASQTASRVQWLAQDPRTECRLDREWPQLWLDASGSRSRPVHSRTASRGVLSIAAAFDSQGPGARCRNRLPGRRRRVALRNPQAAGVRHRCAGGIRLPVFEETEVPQLRPTLEVVDARGERCDRAGRAELLLKLVNPFVRG